MIITKHYAEANEKDIIRFFRDGFNMVYVPIFTPANSILKRFLDKCKVHDMPVILELNPGGIRELLKENESLNMKFSLLYPQQEEYIHYFPNYLNPKFRNWYLNQFREITESVSNYFNEPVIAFSIGAYDGYHIPDSERHAQFSSVSHTKGYGRQTWLPYGKYVEADYRSYLNEQGIQTKDVGFKRISDVKPPNDRFEAKTPLHWTTWIRYRRKYVMDFVRATVRAIKSVAPELPVTGTFDINFSLNDNFATPIVDIDNILDFVILYYYNIGKDQNVISSLLECVSHHFNSSDTPSIAMYEFSSTVSKKPATTRDYLVGSLPFVSGFHFQFFDIDGADSKRYAEFVSLIKQFNTENKWSQKPPEAKLAVYISQEDIYVWDKAYHAGLILNRNGIPYDVIYNLNLSKSFPYLYIPDGQPIFEANPETQAFLDNYIKKHGKIVENLEKMTLNELKDE